MSVAELSHAKFDDQTDPSGKLREAQSLWGSVRIAYRSGSAVEFNQASAAWLAMMPDLGLEIGTDARHRTCASRCCTTIGSRFELPGSA